MARTPKARHCVQSKPHSKKPESNSTRTAEVSGLNRRRRRQRNNEGVAIRTQIKWHFGVALKVKTHAGTSFRPSLACAHIVVLPGAARLGATKRSQSGY